MDIKGSYVLDATPEEIWNKILDPGVLERIIPGVKTLNAIGDDAYDAFSEIKMGPVKGAFTGHLAIRDQHEYESCKVVLGQESKIGNATAEIAMQLVRNDEGGTTVDYTGNAKLYGTLARMGGRIVGGVVKTLARQFFEGLENELKSN